MNAYPSLMMAIDDASHVPVNLIDDPIYDKSSNLLFLLNGQVNRGVILIVVVSTREILAIVFRHAARINN